MNSCEIQVKNFHSEDIELEKGMCNNICYNNELTCISGNMYIRMDESTNPTDYDFLSWPIQCNTPKSDYTNDWQSMPETTIICNCCSTS